MEAVGSTMQLLQAGVLVWLPSRTAACHGHLDRALAAARATSSSDMG
jgi:hypothetical protein